MVAVLDRLTGLRAIAVLAPLFLLAIALGEHDLGGTFFTLTVATALAALLLVVARRPRFAVFATWAILGVITTISAAKMKYMGVSLHAFDTFFYLRDSSIAGFLIGSFTAPLLGVAALALAGGGLLWWLFRRERPVAGARRFAWALPIVVVAPVIAYPNMADDRLASYYFGYHLTSSLFTSFSDIGALFSRPKLVDRLARIPETGAYGGATACRGDEAKPDIVVSLMESAFPVSLYPQIRRPAELDRAMLSSDGRLRGLRVETFGGGTWITTTALFTGLPTTEFDWMRPYLPFYLDGRVNHSLFRALERCGYDTAVVSPLAYGFVGEGAFLTSIGARRYHDWKAIGAASKHERDKVYFSAALDRLRAHRAADGRPLLIFVMTMATHSPFARRFSPEETLTGEPWGNDPELDEFLRRLVLQRRDFDAFAARLADDPGPRGTVLVDFGDHQPTIVRDLAERTDPKALADWSSVAYRTYYRITGLGRPLARPLPDHDVLDVPYLGVTILEAAGLPLDDVHTELASLRDRCAGHFAGCADRAAVDRHLKRFANARMLDLERRWSPFGP